MLSVRISSFLAVYLCLVSRISNFKHTLIIISVTIVLILGSQVYRTVNNYQQNKQRFVNDVQRALDLSVEKYYADKARSHFAVMTLTGGDSVDQQISRIAIGQDSLEIDSEYIVSGETSFVHPDGSGFQYAWSSNNEDVKVKKEVKKFRTDSGERTIMKMTTTEVDSIEDFDFTFVDFSRLTQKIMVSSSEEMLDVDQLKEILKEELDRRNLAMDYQVIYSRGKANPANTKYALTTSSKSTYLMPGEKLSLNFENATLLILKKGAVDLIISFLIVFSVIGALLYLYRIIKAQKELAMIKDDLIGNVTHEFKTPIATVSTALEGIANFNEANDQEKTKRYVEMSRDQLAKLNLMVEKLMETATIDSGEMEVNKVETNLTELTRHVADSFQIRMEGKTFQIDLPNEDLWGEVDPFHMENVLTNLLDNAVKYGGNEISLSLKKKGDRITWQVVDNGGNIEKPHQQRIFEKLYRIPKGNQHDVKGFGIGLYYTRAALERQGGQISLDVSTGRTCFTVTI